MSRPVTLTDEKIEKLVQYVSNGNYIETAAAACGFTDASYYRWMRLGKQIEESAGDNEVELDSLNELERQSYKLYQRMRIANAEAEAVAVLHIRKAMPKQWMAAMTFLERRYPARWRRTNEVRMVDGFDAEPESLDESLLLKDPDAVRLLHEALTYASREGKEPVVEAEVVPELPQGDD